MAAAVRSQQARQELHDLRVEEWSELALGILAMALSLVATQTAPKLAFPLLLGGFFVTFRGVLASVRRWELFERLLVDSDAYDIPEIHARAVLIASFRNRVLLAETIRSALAGAGPYQASRLELVAGELAALADELTDETLSLDPYCAVRCQRLLNDGAESPLVNPGLPADGLRSTIRRIRAGFEPG
jgi:hypothetical protein